MLINLKFKRLRAALAFGVCVSVCQPASAETTFISAGDAIGVVRFAQLRLDDSVTDRCWTNASSVLSQVKLILEQSDIETFSEERAFMWIQSPILVVSGTGFRANNLCAVFAQLSVYYRSSSQYGGAGGTTEYSVGTLSRHFSVGTLFTSGNNVNDQLKDFFTGGVSEFASQVLSARRKPEIVELFEANPGFANPPPTTEEFENMLKGITDSTE